MQEECAILRFAQDKLHEAGIAISTKKIAHYKTSADHNYNDHFRL